VSHYARIVEPLPISGPIGTALFLALNTEIKCVTVIRGGGYAFDARIGGRWCPMLTDVDLPAYTDLGREQRLESKPATLRRGRPLRSNITNTATITVRLRADQKKALGEDYGRRVLAALVAAGMVPQ